MISREKWGEIIKDFHEKLLPEVIERDIRIPVEIPIKRAISIIGPRRAGKTYTMFQLIRNLFEKNEKEQVLYVNLERADIGIVNSEDLVKMLEVFYELFPKNKSKKVWLFLDEIQTVSNWEKFVRMALDEGVNVFISGSSSKLLSKEIATSMRGRTISYTILPFSFKEYLRAKNIKAEKFLSSSEKIGILNALGDYLQYGGYPEAIIYEKEREKILAEIKETLIYKDIVERHKIRNMKALKLLIDALTNSKEFSAHKFYNFLKSLGVKTSKTALYNYLQYLNDAFFIFTLRKFSYSYKELEQSIPKIYFFDNGLLRIGGVTDYGRLMENLVFIELFRRNKDIFYYKSPTKEEVDFVIKKDKKIKQLIQVCYDIQNISTKEREIKALIKAGKELKCKNLIIITERYEAQEKIKGNKIKFISLWKWLLNEKE